MPSSTPLYGIPFPLDSDPVTDGADAMAALAARVETLLGYKGSAVVPIVASDNGNVVVNFPAAFAATPRVFVTLAGGSSQYMVSVSATSTTQTTIVARRQDAGVNTTVNLTVFWWAVPA